MIIYTEYLTRIKHLKRLDLDQRTGICISAAFGSSEEEFSASSMTISFLRYIIMTQSRF